MTDLHTLSGAYVLHAVSDEEAAEFKKHLAACDACRQEVRELQEAAARMGADEALVPPAHLKARVLAAADRQPQLPPTTRGGAGPQAPGRRWLPRLLLAAAAVVLVVAGGVTYSALQPDEPGTTLAASVVRVFDAPDAHRATMRTTNGGTISVATSPSLGQMAVDTDQLPPLDTGHVYQLWAGSATVMTSAGLLEDPAAGAAMEMPSPGTLVAITIEPAGGSQQPTTQPIMSVEPGKV